MISRACIVFNRLLPSTWICGHSLLPLCRTASSKNEPSSLVFAVEVTAFPRSNVRDSVHLFETSQRNIVIPGATSSDPSQASVKITSNSNLQLDTTTDFVISVWRHERPFASTTVRMLPVQEAAKLWTLRMTSDPGTSAGQNLDVSAGDLVLLHPRSPSASFQSTTVRAILGKLDISPCLDFLRFRRQLLAESRAVERQLDAADYIAAGNDTSDLPASKKGVPLQSYGNNISVVEEVVTPAGLDAAEKACREVLRSISAFVAVNLGQAPECNAAVAVALVIPDIGS